MRQGRYGNISDSGQYRHRHQTVWWILRKRRQLREHSHSERQDGWLWAERTGLDLALDWVGLGWPHSDRRAVTGSGQAPAFTRRLQQHAIQPTQVLSTASQRVWMEGTDWELWTGAGLMVWLVAFWDFHCASDSIAPSLAHNDARPLHHRLQPPRNRPIVPP